MKGRRKVGQENVRSLVKSAGGRSYSVTLPIEVIRAFRWEKKQKLELSVDRSRKQITIRDWSRRGSAGDTDVSRRNVKG